MKYTIKIQEKQIGCVKLKFFLTFRLVVFNYGYMERCSDAIN